jgi:hypothetical protein
MGFRFLTIVRNGPDSRSIGKLPVTEELREEMARAFTIPAGKWEADTLQRTAFDEAYSLSSTEIFEIRQFALPPDLLNAARFPDECPAFKADVEGLANLKAIVAVNTDGGRVTAIFKIVGKARKFEPAKNLMLLCKHGTYAKLGEPGIMLDDKIAATFTDGTLLFKSPSTVKQVLSLKEYTKEANDLEIIAFLEQRFETDTEKVLGAADTWMRKRFAALMQSNLFEEKSALDIYEAARDFSAEIPMELSKDRSKLVLPEEKQDIRMILKFLNEEYYKGVLTGKDYQTPSKRPLAGAENAGGAPRKRPLNFRG